MPPNLKRKPMPKVDHDKEYRGNIIPDNMQIIPSKDSTFSVDTNAGEADSTATASGGDGSYSFAWTISETADDGNNGSSCAILAEGTKNAARYNTATFRVTKGAELAGAPPVPVDPPPFFSQAVYRLRCTVTDGNGDTATADYTVNIVV